MVWFGLSGTKRQGGYRVLFVNERKRKEKGEAASVCECEGSNRGGLVETMEAG